MKSLIKWIGGRLAAGLPLTESDLAPLPAGKGRKLWLSPVAFLQAINGLVIADWALAVAAHLCRPRLGRGPGGRPSLYSERNILLMAVMQTAWRLSYADIVELVATDEALAAALDFTYIVVVAVALAAQRYQRPDLVRSRASVLAHAQPRFEFPNALGL